jgi:hypothetical protein
VEQGAKTATQLREGYLARVLASAAKPFVFPARARRLLGIVDGLERLRPSRLADPELTYRASPFDDIGVVPAPSLSSGVAAPVLGAAVRTDDVAPRAGLESSDDVWTSAGRPALDRNIPAAPPSPASAPTAASPAPPAFAAMVPAAAPESRLPQAHRDRLAEPSVIMDVPDGVQRKLPDARLPDARPPKMIALRPQAAAPAGSVAAPLATMRASAIDNVPRQTPTPQPPPRMSSEPDGSADLPLRGEEGRAAPVDAPPPRALVDRVGGAGSMVARHDRVAERADRRSRVAVGDVPVRRSVLATDPQSRPAPAPPAARQTLPSVLPARARAAESPPARSLPERPFVDRPRGSRASSSDLLRQRLDEVSRELAELKARVAQPVAPPPAPAVTPAFERQLRAAGIGKPARRSSPLWERRYMSHYFLRRGL